MNKVWLAFLVHAVFAIVGVVLVVELFSPDSALRHAIGH